MLIMLTYWMQADIDTLEASSSQSYVLCWENIMQKKKKNTGKESIWLSISNLQPFQPARTHVFLFLNLIFLYIVLINILFISLVDVKLIYKHVYTHMYIYSCTFLYFWHILNQKFCFSWSVVRHKCCYISRSQDDSCDASILVFAKIKSARSTWISRLIPCFVDSWMSLGAHFPVLYIPGILSSQSCSFPSSSGKPETCILNVNVLVSLLGNLTNKLKRTENKHLNLYFMFL